MPEIDRVLYNVDLGFEIRRDVDRSVGDDQRILVAGDIHHKAMADAASGANAGLACDHRTHQLVGVQAALHQGLGLPLADDLDRLVGGIVAVRRFLQREARYVEPRPLGDSANAVGGTDQDRRDQAQPRGLHGTFERDLITRMRDRRRHRRQALRVTQKPLVALVRADRVLFHGSAHSSARYAALSRPISGGGPANTASTRSSLRRPSSGSSPRAASTRRTNVSASSHCRRLLGNSFGSAAIARSASSSRIRYWSLTISLNLESPTRLAAGNSALICLRAANPRSSTLPSGRRT